MTRIYSPGPCAGAILLAFAASAHAAPQAAPAERSAAMRCTSEAARPGKLALTLGKSTMLRLPEPVGNRTVGDPGVVQALLVAPDTLYVAGIDVGATNMFIQGRSGACSVVEVTVGMDTGAVQATLAAVMPEEKDIRVLAAADALILTGTVTDATAVARAMDLAAPYVRRPLRTLPGKKKDDPAGAGGGADAAPSAAGDSARLVNLLNVSAPQQVMLEVKIAEVSKSLLESLEVGATLRFASGSWAGALLSNFLSGTSRGLFDARKSNGNQITFAADKQDGLVRMLAEPTVMAISGQEGSFLAGGKIFIPVAQDNDRITLEEREFGVGLRFTPTVLSGGRINLKVAPEVSELAHGATVSAMPVITTRRASTTVQLFDGQSFAIGGLIRNNNVSNVNGLPGLSELPVLGALFRSTDYQQDRSELVFVVTPRLVKPLAADYVLPTDKLKLPTRTELLLGGRLEGAPAEAAAAADVK